MALQAADAPGRIGHVALAVCAGGGARTSVWGRASHMTCSASWLRPTPPACVRPWYAAAPRSRWGVGAEARSCGCRRCCRPPARPFLLPPGRHHVGAHLPPAGLVSLALLEGGDGADAGGAAVLRQDHLRQCHRGECRQLTRPGRRSPRVLPARLLPEGPGRSCPQRGGANESGMRGGGKPFLSPPRGPRFGVAAC